MAQMEFENMNWNVNLAESSSLEDQAKWYLGVASKDTKVRRDRKVQERNYTARVTLCPTTVCSRNIYT